MELAQQFSVPAPVDVVWDAFGDLNRIGGCLPGATITSVDGDEFTGTVKVKLGPISLLYTGTGHYAERDESARRVVIEAKGKDKRGNGTASATITAQLTVAGAAGAAGAAAASGTSVAVTTDLSITGKPAQFGRGVIQDVSDKLLGQFVECIKDKLIEPDPASSAIEEAAAEAEGAAAAGAVAAAEAGAAASLPLPAAVGSSAGADADVGTDADRAAGTSGWVRPDARATGTAPPTIGHTPSPPPVSGPEPEIDLMSTIGPALAKRIGPVLLAALGGFVVAILLRRRARSRRCRSQETEEDE